MFLYMDYIERTFECQQETVKIEHFFGMYVCFFIRGMLY